jgi:hypothetical protein
MKPKYLRCIYNASRKCSDQFVPLCVWPEKSGVHFPPHVYISSSPMDETTCSRCKVFVEEKKDARLL